MTTELTATRGSEYAERIRTTFRQSVEAIMETGRILAEAKDKLKHGEFTAMVTNELPFSPRTAQMMMALTGDARLSDPKHASLLPPSWYTLYKLSELHDDEFERGITQGIIRPDMTRSEVKKLHAVPGHLVAKAQASGTALPSAPVTVQLVKPDGVSEADIEQAVSIVKETHRASTSALQRRLRIGFTRAARLMDILDERGIIGPPNGSEPREVFLDKIEAAEAVAEEPSEPEISAPCKEGISVRVLCKAGLTVQCALCEWPSQNGGPCPPSRQRDLVVGYVSRSDELITVGVRDKATLILLKAALDGVDGVSVIHVSE